MIVVSMMVIWTRRGVEEVTLQIRKFRLEHVVRPRRLRPGTEGARRWMLALGRH